MGNWRWLHADLLLAGRDLCDLAELDANTFFDLVDTLFINDALRDAQHEGGLTKSRASLDKVYDRRSHTIMSDTNGGSNDDAGVELGPTGQPMRDPQPYTRLIEPSETGYPGLEPPVG